LFLNSVDVLLKSASAPNFLIFFFIDLLSLLKFFFLSLADNLTYSGLPGFVFASFFSKLLKPVDVRWLSLALSKASSLLKSNSLVA